MSDMKREKEHCVEVNVFVKCKDGSWKKAKEETCVRVNVYAECEEFEKKWRNECDEC